MVGVPIDDNRREKIETGDPEMLALDCSIADLALPWQVAIRQFPNCARNSASVPSLSTDMSIQTETCEITENAFPAVNVLFCTQP